jgi:hypothetical protein
LTHTTINNIHCPSPSTNIASPIVGYNQGGLPLLNHRSRVFLASEPSSLL